MAQPTLTIVDYVAGTFTSGTAIAAGGGSFWYVNSAKGQDSNGKGINFKAPFKTLSYAFSSGKMVSGDVVIVAAGHAEDITKAAAIACATAGITVVGMGNGSSRPTFTFKTVNTATITITAANVKFVNCIFDLTGVASLATGFSISAAGTSASFEHCMFTGNGASNCATTAVTTSGASTRFYRCSFDFTGATTGAASAVVTGAAVSGLSIEDSIFRGNFSTACVVAGSTNHATNMHIWNSQFYQSNGTAKAVLSFTTSSTGLVHDNRFVGTTWSTAADAIGSNSSNVALRWLQNYGFDDGAGIVSAVLVPAAGTIA